MKIAIASDHAGFRYKTVLVQHLAGAGHDVVDFGTTSTDSVDYPDFVHPAAVAVASGRCERGIVLGGSGNGAGSRTGPGTSISSSSSISLFGTRSTSPVFCVATMPVLCGRRNGLERAIANAAVGP